MAGLDPQLHCLPSPTFPLPLFTRLYSRLPNIPVLYPPHEPFVVREFYGHQEKALSNGWTGHRAGPGMNLAEGRFRGFPYSKEERKREKVDMVDRWIWWPSLEI